MEKVLECTVDSLPEVFGALFVFALVLLAVMAVVGLVGAAATTVGIVRMVRSGRRFQAATAATAGPGGPEPVGRLDPVALGLLAAGAAMVVAPVWLAVRMFVG